MENDVILVALGANLPCDAASNGRSPAETLTCAIRDLPEFGLEVSTQSRFFLTPCFPAGAGPDYVNAAVSLRARHPMSASVILSALHAIEARYGRARTTRWAGRTLDLDLLAIGAMVLPDVATFRHWHAIGPADQARLTPDRLILPHPRMADRGFVLVPLAEIAPDWRHPVLGTTVRQMCDALAPDDRAAIRPLAAA